MIYSVDFVELAGKINHVAVSKYLRDLGWREFPSRREGVKIFQLEHGQEFFQVDLPISRDLRDYNRGMYRAVESIAQSTQRGVEQVILELLNPLSDILRLRIQEPNLEAGSMLVEDAIALYDNAKKLITATAMDLLRPQMRHSGRPDDRIVNFVSNCRFGQTEIGSYVVSVVCPISEIEESGNVKQRSLFDDEEDIAESFTRKVVNKLISSVREVKSAIDAGNLKNSIQEHCASENNCISVNFLEALSAINIYRKDSSLEIAAKYAPTVFANRLDDTVASIDHDYFKPINAFVQKVKCREVDEKTYIGKVSKLKASPDPLKRRNGEVAIVFLDESEKKATASVILGKEDYNAAIEAHREGKAVKIVSTMSGQTHKKMECSHFEVLD